MRLIDADMFEKELEEELLPALIEEYGEAEANNGLHFSFRDIMNNLAFQPEIMTTNLSLCCWISCAGSPVMLPKEGDTCLITTKLDGVRYARYLGGGGWLVTEVFGNVGCDHTLDISDVLAWAYMPEPYKGGQDDT